MILARPFNRCGTGVEFDPMTGFWQPVEQSQSAAEAQPDVSGCLFALPHQACAIYRQDQQLVLQINHRIWHLNSDDCEVKYLHCVSSGTTTFTIADTISSKDITYTAWWQKLGLSRPGQPEEDEQHDFFAYVAEVANNAELQQSLLTHWK
ncbi:hypothetical protein [Oceanobacter kriegii]|uniref:hypothetical protein n=1 Tax=Oceanobacter kriegii TaxID=64972 RepID=UPI0003FF71EC|nr:hypothetical protein [Oceanobacter kriegii]